MDERDFQKITQWVTEWLDYCEKNTIKPWKFDFKMAYLDDVQPIIGDGSSLSLEIAYKYTNLLNGKHSRFNITGKTGRNSDTDKEPFHIYRVLGWQNNIGDSVRGETINSFATTFTQLLRAGNGPFGSENKLIWEQKCQTVPKLKATLAQWVEEGTLNEQASDFHFNTFNQQRRDQELTDINLLAEIEQFAMLTSSIGNFTVVLSWLNQGRGVGNVKDYWDLTLHDLHSLLPQTSVGADVWQTYIAQYYLQPYVGKNYQEVELWPGHFTKPALPKTIADFECFYHNINLAIVARGKWITKVLYEKLGLTDHELYVEELKNLSELSSIQLAGDKRFKK